MKKLLPALLCLVVLTGCVMRPQWPKDSYIEKGGVRVTTPWGGYEMTVEGLATGSAARNVTAPGK